MPPIAYPIIGFIAGMIGGWFWQNIKPGLFAALLMALLAGLVPIAIHRAEGMDYLIVGLGAFLAMVMSFFGSVAGTRLKDYFERNSK